MNPVPQLKMQKSPVFCVAHAGSWRLELFLFSHLGRDEFLSVHLLFVETRSHDGAQAVEDGFDR